MNHLNQLIIEGEVFTMSEPDIIFLVNKHNYRGEHNAVIERKHKFVVNANGFPLGKIKEGTTIRVVGRLENDGDTELFRNCNPSVVIRAEHIEVVGGKVL